MGDPSDPLLSLNETPPDSIESWIQMEMKLDWEWQNSTWRERDIYIYTHHLGPFNSKTCCWQSGAGTLGFAQPKTG